MSAGETVQEKAGRYLSAGQLTILLRVDGKVLATVNGDSGKHTVTIDDLERWRCSCPVMGTSCSHIAAVSLVVGIAVPLPPALLTRTVTT